MKALRFPLGFGVVFMVAWTGLMAQAPDAKKDESKAQQLWRDKKIAFEMREKPWKQVMEWFSDQTDLPFVSAIPPPTGTFTFINPRVGGQPKLHTLPEIHDIINDELLKHKYILLRRPASLTIIPADERIPDSPTRLITPADLDHLPKMEIVRIVLDMKGVVAEDLAPEIKKLMGPFGSVVALSQFNQLLLQDQVVHLRKIKQVVDEIGYRRGDQYETFNHKCVHIRARDAETQLKKALGGEQESAKTKTQPGSGADSPRTRSHAIVVSEANNSVMVIGPADKVALAKSVMTKIDVPAVPNGPPIPVGPPNCEPTSLRTATRMQWSR